MPEAKKAARAALEPSEWVLSEKVITDGKEKQALFEGQSLDHANNSVYSTIPLDAKLLKRETRREAGTVQVEIEAESAETAKKLAAARYPDRSAATTAECVRPARAGLFGIGKRLAKFRVAVDVTAVVHVQYRPMVTVSVSTGSIGAEITPRPVDGSDLDGDLAELSRVDGGYLVKVAMHQVGRLPGGLGAGGVLIDNVLAAFSAQANKRATSELERDHKKVQGRVCSCGKYGFVLPNYGKVYHTGNVRITYDCRACGERYTETM